MKLSKLSIYFVILAPLCFFLLFSAYREVENRGIEQLNDLQYTMARQAAAGIESHLGNYRASLEELARNKHVISIDEDGAESLAVFHNSRKETVLAIIRTDAEGKVIHSFPPNPQLTTLERHEHIQEVIRSQRPVVSDVFISWTGSQCVALHVPVFDGEGFRGSLGVLIAFDRLAQKYLEGIRIGDEGYAWMISAKGVELYCPVPGHVGKTVFENCKDSPTVLSMASEMLKGRQGTATYIYDRIRGQSLESIEKYAVYVPVDLGNTFWSIVVATPKSEMMHSIQGFRNRWFLAAGLLLVSAALMTYLFVRSRLLAREEAKRRKTEDALHRSEEKYRELVECANSIIIRTDRFGNVIFFNEFAQRFFGFRGEEVIGKNVVGLIMPEIESTGRDMREMIEDLGANPDRYVNNQHENLRSNGERVWIAWTHRPIFDETGQVAEILSIGNDITERKRAEEALRESEQLLYSIIQRSPVPTFVISPDHRVLYWNRALEETSGISAGKIVGTNQHWKAFYPSERPCMADLLVEEGDGISESLEKRCVKSKLIDGAYEATEYFTDLPNGGKWFNFTAAPIRDSRGKIACAIETLQDITAFKKLEEALTSANRQLADIIEFLPDATLVVDREGKVIAWNRAIEEMTGVDKKDMIGRGDRECTIPFYGERRPHLLDLLDSGDGEMKTRYRQVRRKGNVLSAQTFVPCVYGGRGAHVLATAAPLFDAHGKGSGGIESIRDISDYVKKETALRESEARYRAFISNSSEAIWRIEAEKPIPITLSVEEQIQQFYQYGYMAECNDVTARMYGLGSADRLIGARFAQLLNRSDERNHDLLRLFINSSYRVVQHELYRKDRQGNERCFLSSFSGTVDNDCLVRVWGVQRDITDFKKAEEVIRESQQQLADIIDFLPDATFVIDSEGRVIAWNRAIEEMTGVRAADMLGRGNYEYALTFYGERRPILIDLVLKPEEEIEAKYIKSSRKGAVLEGEAYMPALRGGEAYLFGSASELRDSRGKIVGAIESIRDITDRKRVEEALRNAEKKYRNIFENAVMGIFQTVRDGRLVSANLAFARLLAYDSVEEMLESIPDIGTIYVNYARRADFLRLIEETGTVRGFEVEFYRKDGSIASVCLNARAVQDNAGGFMLEGTAEDVTARKTLENKLRQSQKIEAIGTLAGGIAHDFNNMLSPVIGYTELLLNQLEADFPMRHSLEKILHSSLRARDLVKQILTFSRQADQERKPLRMGALVEEVLKLLRSTLPSTIEIRRKIGRDINDTVMADSIQIHQVLMNLCTNAGHAMREKGGLLEVALDNVEVDAGTEKTYTEIESGAYLRLTVSDTGHGMDEAVRQRIFDPYFTTKGPDEGTGLGLAVVYGIVKSLSGCVTVSSEKGQGTVFHVLFPAVERKETGAVLLPEPAPGGRGYILVVDDEKYIAEMLRDMLEHLGYEVNLRYGSADALAAFRAESGRFDMVITDQTMPGMTGAALAKEILKIRPTIPIILNTGFSEMVDEKKARQLGVRAFLMKPIAFQQLAREVHAILGHAD